MKVMKPISTNDIPKGATWLYEVKFDGFRCMLHWEKNEIKLTSAKNKNLTEQFPEIITYCQENQHAVQPFLPFTLDGELVILNNAYQANFANVQQRGRLKNKTTIQKKSAQRPATFMVFDLVIQKGKSLHQHPFDERKQLLQTILQTAGLHDSIQYVPAHTDSASLWKKIFDYKAEGIIAKHKHSTYYEGKKHQAWFKVKNWRTIEGFLTEMNRENDYFTIAVYDEENIQPIGKCKHGLERETMETLKQLFLTKGVQHENIYKLPPAICAAIHTLDQSDGELREPEFKQLLPEQKATACTIEQLKLDLAMIPHSIELTNTAKVFWPAKNVTKGDLLLYIRDIAPYMLPFLENKALTMIRAPDGVEEEYFFQKHMPAYAPDFIDSLEHDDEKVILCNQSEALVWFANHGAVEYHVPFQTIGQAHPNEIVFDLDPPGREKFALAIEAALMIKTLLDELNLISFVKTSGNKGLQIHLPILAGTMTYKETAYFTEAIATTLVQASPDLFTIERLKKNRHGRLYIDYVQHGKDKTLIAPYSPRKTHDATVATPLFWHEVKQGLTPDSFTIQNVIERIHLLGCPFHGFAEAREQQRVEKVLEMMRE